MPRGLFVSFEGGEGCGKSTQIRLLADRLKDACHRVLLTREPGGTEIGEQLRHLLQFSKAGHAMASETELLLFTASRAQLVREVIAPALSEGTMVLADRFLDSTTVYQGVARRLDPSEVAAINRFAVGGTVPDLTFVLDLDPAIARERMQQRHASAPDRMEGQPPGFYDAVRAGYLALAKNHPERVRLLDAAGSVEDLAERIWQEIQSWFLPPLRPPDSHFHRMPFTSDEAFALLQNVHARDRLAHAYLFAGPTGSGKRALANRLCDLLLGEKVAGLQHPDIHTIEPESKSRRILIEQIRELERNLQMRSLRGGNKIGIIVDADRLQPNAANAFLKTLEEPPGHSTLLLLSSQPDQLLETILSRCLEIPLRLVEAREATPLQKKLLGTLQTHAHQERPGLVDAFRLVREFQTLLGEAREVIQANADAALKAEEQHYKQTSDAGRWLEEREDYYKALVESRYVAARHSLLETLEQWWADALRLQATPSGESGAVTTLDQPAFAADTTTLAARYSTSALLRKSDAFEALREHLGNPGVQEQLALECAFLRAFGE